MINTKRFGFTNHTASAQKHIGHPQWAYGRNIGNNDTEQGKIYDLDPATYGSSSQATNSSGTVAAAVDILRADWEDATVAKAELVIKAKMVRWADNLAWRVNLRASVYNLGDLAWGLKDDGFTYKYGFNWYQPGRIQYPHTGWPGAEPKEVLANYVGGVANHDINGPGELADIRVDITGKSFDWTQLLGVEIENTYGDPPWFTVIPTPPSDPAIFDIYSCFVELTYKLDTDNASATLSSFG